MGEEDHTAPLSAYALPERKSLLGHPTESAKKLIQEVPDGKLVIIPESGHIPHLEQPQAFRDAVFAFLKQPAH
jgi:pimeloyl-ACP methyl ester carboxylesterase